MKEFLDALLKLDPKLQALGIAIALIAPIWAAIHFLYKRELENLKNKPRLMQKRPRGRHPTLHERAG
jgi:hypothetical protein